MYIKVMKALNIFKGWLTRDFMQTEFPKLPSIAELAAHAECMDRFLLQRLDFSDVRQLYDLEPQAVMMPRYSLEKWQHRVNVQQIDENIILQYFTSPTTWDLQVKVTHNGFQIKLCSDDKPSSDYSRYGCNKRNQSIWELSYNDRSISKLQDELGKLENIAFSQAA